MDGLKHVNFRPWVGENYFENNCLGYKLLVLGESHYCKFLENGICKKCVSENMNDECFASTNNVVTEFLIDYADEKKEPYLQSFLCFERAVFNKELSSDEEKKFWNSVVFYNYFQNAQPKAGCDLVQNENEKSAEAFREVLETFMPDYIIMWGVRLFNNTPCWDGKGRRLVADNGESTRKWIYNINGKEIPAMQVHHPCRGKGRSRDYWHPFYKKFLPETTWDIVSQ